MTKIRDACVKNAASLSPDEIAAWENFSTTEPQHSSPFLSAHFARAVAEADADAQVCIVHDDGDIAAFFPYLYPSARHRRWKVADRVGGELTDSFGIIASSGFRTTPQELLKLADINYLSFSHLEEGQLQYGLTGEQPRIGLRARLDVNAVPALQSVSSVTKHYLRDSAKRQRKICEEVGPLNFQFDVREDRSQTLERLIEQKRAQYKSSGVPDALEDEWKKKTLFNLLGYEFETCKGVLSTLYAGDQWIASHFGIMSNGNLNLWFPVYNPEFSRYSPGRLLLHHIVESCREHGFHTLDRGEGDTPRKREIANEEYQLYRGVWQNGSGTSQMVHGLNRIKWKIGL
jgi:CelD/BcsL family acetyltransferase involved in cellulose biosynthesis